MARFSLWDPRKNLDYQFFDETIQEMFEAGATSVFVHKYLGTENTSGGDDPSQPNYDKLDPLNIQDMLFLENRDRVYDPNVYELLGVYNILDTEFDMTQFGIILDTDSFHITFHLNDSVRRLGRKLMPGDVFELPHLRESPMEDGSAPAINKFYVVEDVSRAAEGYSPTWFPHLIRAKVRALTDTQEYKNILDRPAEDANGDPIADTTLRDIISDYKNQIGVSDAILEAAEKEVDRRNFETLQFYVVPGDEVGQQYPWIFAGDGNPPNGAEPVDAGSNFPDNAQEGDWYLRTDMEPHVLFRKVGSAWRRQEVDYRKKWNAAHRILHSFLHNNQTSTLDNGEVVQQKVALSKVGRPRADF